MKARYFRYLFEQQEETLIHSGYVYDRFGECALHYIYMYGGSRGPKDDSIDSDRVQNGSDGLPEEIDLFVVAGYRLSTVRQILRIITQHRVRIMILPYLTPVQRLVLVQDMQENGWSEPQALHYLEDPYLYLKNRGISQIFFLYQNTAGVAEDLRDSRDGMFFEDLDPDITKLIAEMEGYPVPVMRAGYFRENGWMFYFGVYGTDIRKMSAFTREYFSRAENFCPESDDPGEDYRNQMHHLADRYWEAFGRIPVAAVVMFAGPTEVEHRYYDSCMIEREYERERCRMERENTLDGGYYKCTIACLRNRDYDTMQHHKNNKEMRFGILLLGFPDLKQYFNEIFGRFWKIRPKVRILNVPGNGETEYWNPHILDISEGENSQNRIYWIQGRSIHTSSQVIQDIVMSSVYNRLIPVDEMRGVCFSGYLLPKEDGRWC